jgi:hypothetical protein
MGWRQNICDDCWAEQEPGREPIRLKEEFRETERCSWCGKFTTSGIYRRADPASVPYPAGD